MLCVIPFCASDAWLATELCRWIWQLGGVSRHDALLVVDPATPWTDVLACRKLLEPAFKSVGIVTSEHSISGWLPGSVALFKTATAAAHYRPFFWLEPDAVPLRATWLDELEDNYQRCGKKFMGPMVSHQKQGLPSPYLEGCAVYPADALDIMGPVWRDDQSWTFACAGVVVPQAVNTPLVQHLWGEKGAPPTFADRNIPNTNVFSLRALRPEAVVFHRCKDASLIRVLSRNHMQGNGHVKLQLPSVTLWTCVWNNSRWFLERAMRVLTYCQKYFEFGEVLFFCHPDIKYNGGWKFIKCPLMTMQEWSVFINSEVPKHVRTDFALSVHEDGFPIRPDLWTPEFLRYDYIGAPWPDKVVGNGGFYLESRRLMQAKQSLPPNREPVKNADMWLCRTHRQTLEQQGIRFAPFDLAQRFSSELTGQDGDSFGFHGRKWNPKKYAAGWKILEAIETVPAHVVYVYWGDDYAKRFTDSYRKYPPGEDHHLIVVCNDGNISETKREIFKGIPCEFIAGDNRGYDIGAYQKAAASVDTGLIVFFGCSTYLTGANWLSRMRESFLKHGQGIYGTMGNRGMLDHKNYPAVYPHIRSTAFWMDVNLFKAYPYQVTTKEARYPFEHGQDCLTEWVKRQGFKTMVVAWQGEFDNPQWDVVPNGYHRGNQSNLIAGDHLTEAPFYPPKKK